jgi:hypothetical protein
MSAYSEQDHLNPNNPTYYAPRWLRESSRLRLIASSEPGSERPRDPVSSSPPFDGLLEEAVPEALLRPLDPEVIYEPPGFGRELDRRIALINVAGRFAAAVGVSALVAAFFAIMVPASRDYARPPDGGAPSFSRILQSIRTAFYQPPRKDDDSKSAASELQTILTSTRTSQAAVITHEESETLLQQFLQWRQKPGSTGAPQQ